MAARAREPGRLLAIVGMRGGLASGRSGSRRSDRRCRRNGVRCCRRWRSRQRRRGPVELEAEIDGGQLVARMAPRAPVACCGSGLVRPSPTLQSWRLLVVRWRFRRCSGGERVVFAGDRQRAAGGCAARWRRWRRSDRARAALQRARAGRHRDRYRHAGAAPRGVAPDSGGMVRDLAARSAWRRSSRGGRRRARGAQSAGLHQVAPRSGSAPRRALPEATRAAIDHASSEIMRLDRLVADLLIVSGRAVGTRATLDLGRCSMRGRGAGSLAALRQIAIDVHGGGPPRATPMRWPAPSTTSCGRHRGVAGGAAVEASVEEDGDRLRVRIADRGEGWCPAARVRSSSRSSRPTRRHGPGLAISRAIARAHGGDLVYRREGGSRTSSSRCRPKSSRRGRGRRFAHGGRPA